MFRRSLLQLTGAAFLAMATALGPTSAQAEYPEKPITLVVGFSAGGGTDTYGRTMASLIHESLGMPMVVANKPGAAGMIAAKFVEGQPADGYTLYMASAGSFLVKYLYDRDGAPVSPLEDFRILGMIGASIPGLLVPEDSPFESAAALVAYAKENPGKLRWAHPGRGSLFQLTGEAFLRANGIDTQDVPFKGGSKARNAVAGGQVDFGFMGVQLGKGFESRVNVLGVAGTARDAANEDVPTFDEQGLPIVKLINPQMIMAPAGMSDADAAKVTAAIKATVEGKSYSRILGKAGLSPTFMEPAQARNLLEDLQQQLSPIIEETRG